MDPNEALRLMVEAFARENKDGGLAALEDLRNWLTGGGFVPATAAAEFVGAVPQRILVKIEDVPDGVNFCKHHGETWYRKVSDDSAKHYVPVQPLQRTLGVTDYGNLTAILHGKTVWVLPPDDWEQKEPWVELMTQYTDYDPEEPH